MNRDLVLDGPVDPWTCLFWGGHAWLATVFSHLPDHLKLSHAPWTLQPPRKAIQLPGIQSQIQPPRVSLGKLVLWSVVLPHVSKVLGKSHFLSVHASTLLHDQTHTYTLCPFENFYISTFYRFPSSSFRQGQGLALPGSSHSCFSSWLMGWRGLPYSERFPAPNCRPSHKWEQEVGNMSDWVDWGSQEE